MARHAESKEIGTSGRRMVIENPCGLSEDRFASVAASASVARPWASSSRGAARVPRASRLQACSLTSSTDIATHELRAGGIMSRLLLTTPFLIVLSAAVQPPEDNRPPLFFREDWKDIAAATPVTQEHVTNPKLQVALYGPGKDGVRKSHHETPKDDPYYIWLGACPANCAIALRDKDAFVDLTGLAKIRWRTKQTGFRSLRLTLKLADGTWLVSDYAEGPSVDWHESEFSIAGIRWRRMDIKTMVEGVWVNNPDLSKVDEIGWSELAPGGGTPASSRVDWIEVYGRRVAR
jgi:hypothetical protein